jgi:hypothetical protein
VQFCQNVHFEGHGRCTGCDILSVEKCLCSNDKCSELEQLLKNVETLGNDWDCHTLFFLH